MKFQFSTEFTEKDYFDYNIFYLSHSAYGKKQIKIPKWLIITGTVAAAILCFTKEQPFKMFFFSLFVFLLLFCFFNKSFTKFIIKLNIKSLKKSGKPPFNFHLTVEFNENSLTEITETGKNEVQYSAIERISIIESKVIYIHLNTLSSCFVPYRAFASKEEEKEFLAFLTTICKFVDTYPETAIS